MNRRQRLRTALLALALGAGVIAPSAANAASVAAGQRLAQRSCSLCHAVGLAGESPNAKAPPFRDLYKRYPPGFGWIEGAIRDGLLQTHRAMPVMRLTEQETDDLIAYLRSIQKPSRQPGGI